MNSHTLDINLFAGPSKTATYLDRGHHCTQIEYASAYEGNPTKEYGDRNAMLRAIQGKRLLGRAHLPVGKRYREFEMGLKAKIQGVVRRIFYIIAERSVRDGLLRYGLYLQGKTSTLAWANFSAKTVTDFTTTITPSDNLREKLGLKSTDLYKLQTSTHWHFNGLPTCKIKDENVTIHHTVTASNDRNSDKIMMMRRVDDNRTNESIAYTGRPDTEAKAKEQIEFIFRNELGKNFYKNGAGKGITKLEDGTYELTYVVNNLMTSKGILFSSMGLTALVGLDEKESILEEEEILQKIADGNPLEIEMAGTTYKVKINPIYFNQGFNWIGTAGVSSTQRRINTNGYAKLIKYAKSKRDDVASEQRALFDAARCHLKNPSGLKPEEEIFYRDLIANLIKIPTVHHCKSSTDRTGIAVALSTALQNWMNSSLEIPTDNPHTILSDERFKELFIANIASSHQATRVARAPAPGIVLEHHQPTNIIGFEWGKNNYKKNSIAIRLLPDRYKNGNEYALNSPFFTERSLLKPKGMKYHYKGPKTYPKGYRV